MSAWGDVTIRNPLNKEILRYLRRYTDWHGPHKASTIGVMFGLFMVYVLVLGLGGLGGMPSVVTLQMQTGLCMILAPIIAHGVIAGERERRSWELLVAAPITASQIVAAKFLGPAVAILALTTALLPAHLILEYGDVALRWGPPRTPVPLASILLAHALSVWFGLSMVALTVAVSARTRKSATAFASAGGIVLALAVSAPLLNVSEVVLPFQAISGLTDTIFTTTGYAHFNTTTWVLSSLLFSTVLFVGSLTYARIALYRADGDVRRLLRED